jgi:UDP-N-acetylmuramate dehydrogenase
MVSEKHAGFIINYENATASDILRLMEKVQGDVFDHFGVMLESEVRLMK